MKNSIYFRSILFFLAVFFISNTTVIAVLVSAYYNSINISNEDLVVESANTIVKLYDYELDDEMIIESGENTRISVNIYSSINEIEDDYIKNKLLDNDLEISIPKLYEGSQIFVAIKFNDNKFCIVEPKIIRGYLTIRTAIFYSTIITIIVAVFIVFVGISAIMRPLYKLSEAARKVAKGNYNVELEPLNNNDALGQLIDDFNAMCRKLSETELLRKDFLSAISHEFKTPIQSIYGFANLIQEETDNPIHKDYLNRISDEAERLSSLSQNILQLNNLDNMMNINDYKYFYLDEQIRQSLLMLENKWNQKDIRFNIDLAKLQIKANQDMMKQVFINLIDNAIKFTPEKGYIDLKLLVQNNNIVFTIKDSGKGIEEQDKAKIFEKFYKCDQSRNTAGNGLGLTIVKRILDLHGFTISVDNAKPYGAEFTIKFSLD